MRRQSWLVGYPQVALGAGIGFSQNNELFDGRLLSCAAKHAEGVHEQGGIEDNCHDPKNNGEYLADPGRDLNSLCF